MIFLAFAHVKHLQISKDWQQMKDKFTGGNSSIQIRVAEALGEAKLENEQIKQRIQQNGDLIHNVRINGSRLSVEPGFIKVHQLL